MLSSSGMVSQVEDPESSCRIALHLHNGMVCYALPIFGVSRACRAIHPESGAFKLVGLVHIRDLKDNSEQH